MLLAKLAEVYQLGQKSSSSFTHAASAVSHYLHAANPSAESLMANTGKAYRRKYPTAARTHAVPDIHLMFDQVEVLHREKTGLARRDHLACLLLLLTGRRASDLCRVWRHEMCLRFDVISLDEPAWARHHRSRAARLLQQLGWLSSGRGLTDTQFVRLQIRAYLPKTSRATGQRYDSWVPLIENRHRMALCPILAIAEYLNDTNDLTIAKVHRYGKTTVAKITSEDGRSEYKAAPLLVSANGQTRTGLQGSTVSGIVRRRMLTPAGIQDVPHITRATVAAYKVAYGVPVSHVLSLGNWSSHDAFKKHYRRITTPRINPARLSLVAHHDWKLTYAHHLTKIVKGPISTTHPMNHTDNDAAIAAALDTQLQRQHRRRSSRRHSR